MIIGKKSDSSGKLNFKYFVDWNILVIFINPFSRIFVEKVRDFIFEKLRALHSNKNKVSLQLLFISFLLNIFSIYLITQHRKINFHYENLSQNTIHFLCLYYVLIIIYVLSWNSNFFPGPIRTLFCWQVCCDSGTLARESPQINNWRR